MKQAEYDKIVADIVAAEQDCVCDSLNAVFEREGHNQEAIIQAIVQLAKEQSATTARVVSEILLKTGSLPVDS